MQKPTIPPFPQNPSTVNRRQNACKMHVGSFQGLGVHGAHISSTPLHQQEPRTELADPNTRGLQTQPADPNKWGLWTNQGLRLMLSQSILSVQTDPLTLDWKASQMGSSMQRRWISDPRGTYPRPSETAKRMENSKVLRVPMPVFLISEAIR